MTDAPRSLVERLREAAKKDWHNAKSSGWYVAVPYVGDTFIIVSPAFLLEAAARIAALEREVAELKAANADSAYARMEEAKQSTQALTLACEQVREQAAKVADDFPTVIVPWMPKLIGDRIRAMPLEGGE